MIAAPSSLLVPFANYLGLVIYGVFDWLVNGRQREDSHSAELASPMSKQGQYSVKRAPLRHAPLFLPLNIFVEHNHCIWMYRVGALKLTESSFVVLVSCLDILGLCIILMAIKYAGSGLFQGSV